VLESGISQKEFPKALTNQDLSKAAATDAGSVNSLYFKIGDKEYKIFSNIELTQMLLILILF
jgi:hypothetical protein